MAISEGRKFYVSELIGEMKADHTNNSVFAENADVFNTIVSILTLALSANNESQLKQTLLQFICLQGLSLIDPARINLVTWLDKYIKAICTSSDTKDVIEEKEVLLKRLSERRKQTKKLIKNWLYEVIVPELNILTQLFTAVESQKAIDIVQSEIRKIHESLFSLTYEGVTVRFYWLLYCMLNSRLSLLEGASQEVVNLILEMIHKPPFLDDPVVLEEEALVYDLRQIVDLEEFEDDYLKNIA